MLSLPPRSCAGEGGLKVSTAGGAEGAVAVLGGGCGVLRDGLFKVSRLT